MKDFRQASKALRITLLMGITQAMSQDPAVRFPYYHALNDRMIDVLDDLNPQLKAEKDQFDQVKMLNVIFGDGKPVIKKHFVEAVKLLQAVNGEDEVKVGVTAERRDWFEPPVLHAFTLSIGETSTTFSDDGEIYESN